MDKIEAARELLDATKRNLQLVDAQLARLRDGREAVVTAQDVSSEHRAYFIGATDDLDGSNGILTPLSGFNNPAKGTIRNQEDAAFVCTDILVATAKESGGVLQFFEDWVFDNLSVSRGLPYLRLIDGNTGRNLITGSTASDQALRRTVAAPVAFALPFVEPLNIIDRGAIPFSYFTSARPGLGSNIKNRLFSEFTIPRAGTVKAEVFNLGAADSGFRSFVTLLGFKVFGG